MDWTVPSGFWYIWSYPNMALFDEFWIFLNLNVSPYFNAEFLLLLDLLTNLLLRPKKQLSKGTVGDTAVFLVQWNYFQAFAYICKHDQDSCSMFQTKSSWISWETRGNLQISYDNYPNLMWPCFQLLSMCVTSPLSCHFPQPELGIQQLHAWTMNFNI